MFSKCPLHALSGVFRPRGAATALPPLSVMLKSGTQEHHDRAEHHEFQQRFVAGQISRAQYGLFLAQMGHVHAALEPRLREGAAAHPVLRELVDEHHFRCDLIRRDLADLGADQSEPFPATARFVAFIEEIAREDPVALAGVLYVIEGATNGNKIIVKAVQRGLGLRPGEASGYLDPHGAEQRKRWVAFKGKLDAAAMSDAEKERAVAAARRTFELFSECSGELAGV